MAQIRFVRHYGLISAAISIFQNRFWATHVEVVMPDGTWLGALMDGGVQARPANFDVGTVKRQQFIDIPMSDEQHAAFYAFLTAQLGKPYDWTAIMAFAMGRNWRKPDTWFCSELFIAALEHCRWFSTKLATGANHITPRDSLLIVSGRVEIADCE